MNIDNSQTKAIFTFTPAEYLLVFNHKGDFGYHWSLSYRIDRSEKGKYDDVGCPKIYLTDEEVEECKKAGFSWMEI